MLTHPISDCGPLSQPHSCSEGHIFAYRCSVSKLRRGTQQTFKPDRSYSRHHFHCIAASTAQTPSQGDANSSNKPSDPLQCRPALKSVYQCHGCSAGDQRKVLVLGGTGRVGSSTASALLRRRPDVNVILAGRSKKSYDAAIKKRPELADAPVIDRRPCSLCTPRGEIFR